MKIREHESSHKGDWRLAFADDGRGDWRANWFLDGDTATVENTPRGMILRAGPDIKDNGDSMVLWTRATQILNDNQSGIKGGKP
jgi:hypothetical protein